MTKKISKTELLEWFKGHTKITLEEMEKIMFHVEQNNIYQILYSFGIFKTLILLEYFLKTEQYLDCAEIHRQLLSHNKLTGSNCEVTLEEYYKNKKN